MLKHIIWPAFSLLAAATTLQSMQQQGNGFKATTIVGLCITHNNNERMIFSDDGTRILAATQDNPSDVTQYRYDNNQLVPTEKKPLHGSEKARLLNELALTSEGYKLLYSTSYEHHINSSRVITHHHDWQKECVRILFNSPLEDNTLIACAELDEKPLIAYYQPKENKIGITCPLSGQGIESKLPQSEDGQQVKQLSFTRMSNTHYCTINMLLKSRNGAVLYSTEMSFDAKNEINLSRELHEKRATRSAQDPYAQILPEEYMPSVGWSVDGKHSLLIHRIPNKAVLKNELGVMLAAIAVTAYHAIPGAFQTSSCEPRASEEFPILKHISSINKTSVHVSPDGTKAIFDGMLVNLKEYIHHPS